MQKHTQRNLFLFDVSSRVRTGNPLDCDVIHIISGVTDFLKVPCGGPTVNTRLGLHSISYPNVFCVSLRPDVHVQCKSTRHKPALFTSAFSLCLTFLNLTLLSHVTLTPTVHTHITAPCSQQSCASVLYVHPCAHISL